MSTIQENIQQIHKQIYEFATNSQRKPEDITLLAVSKTKPVNDIIEAYNAGLRIFGESYIQEAIDKINQLKEQGYNDIKWHFIGPVQSNKTKAIAEHFDVVQSLDRIKIAKRLNEQRPLNLPPLEVLIQVNISNEPQKSGINFSELNELITEVSNSERLVLKGFMGIAENTTDSQKIINDFTKLYTIFEQYRKIYPQINILSMGMTSDLGEAITSGSTMVRVGSAIFGVRNYHTKR
jgi:pyridoxal phosphate enzyme (YggS family)